MHETSLSRQILKMALEAGERAAAKRVVRVRTRVSETETLSAEAIALHFGAYARGTIAEGAELEVICVHVEAKCGGCGAVYRPEHHVLVCPACGAVGGEELGERGIWVEEVGIED